LTFTFRLNLRYNCCTYQATTTLDIPMCYLLHGLGVKSAENTGGTCEKEKLL